MCSDLFYLLCLMQYIINISVACFKGQTAPPASVYITKVHNENKLSLSPWIPTVMSRNIINSCVWLYLAAVLCVSCCAAERSETVNGQHHNVVNMSAIPSGWTGVPRGWLTVWRRINILQGKWWIGLVRETISSGLCCDCMPSLLISPGALGRSATTGAPSMFSLTD